MQKKYSGSVRIYYPKFSKEELIEKLRQGVKILIKVLPISRVILFGSYARGNYTASSDIDLLVVYDGISRPDAFSMVKKSIAVPMLEPHVYSGHEYEKLKDTISKMTKDGLVLFPE